MKSLTVLMGVLVAVTALGAALATPVPANPVFNGGFEIYAAPVGALVAGSPADRSIGLGHQVMGCGATANLVWQSDCGNNAVAPEDAAAELANDPEAEAEYWMGRDRGDLVIVSPANQNLWTAANWGVYPSGTITFGDRDEDGDREAQIDAGNRMLYQTGLATSTHSAVPASLIDTVSFRLEDGATGGMFQLVMDSFPVEEPASWPQMYYNYKLSMPASGWTQVGDTVVIDPMQGTFSGPASGGYIADTGAHPTADDWNAAEEEEERRAILMEMRVIQFTFWNLPEGAVVDDVAFNLDA